MVIRGCRCRSSLLVAVAVVSARISSAFLAAASAWPVLKVRRVAHVGVVLFSVRGFVLDIDGRDAKSHLIARARVFARCSHRRSRKERNPPGSRDSSSFCDRAVGTK